MNDDYYDGAEFRQGGNVTHQQETRFRDPEQLPKEVEKTLNRLDTELGVDEEYKEAFEIANRLLKFYQEEQKISNGALFAGAALYFGFRCKNAPYLLIEISDLIQKNHATKMAKCYLKLLKFVKGDTKDQKIAQLSKSLQYLDPSIYIPKFVRALNFGQKSKQIVDTALKLIKRMMLDWMAYGRRPSSLCGAALLISARFHGENLSTSDVCKTVQVCDETIRKRLAEFNQTGLSQLTREQFEQIENIETEIPGPVNDPPAFRRIKQQEEEKRKGLNEEEIKKLEESTLQKALEMIEMLKVQPEIYKRENNLINSPQNNQSNQYTQIKISEELSSLSEADENDYILSEQEIAYKQSVWNTMYRDHMFEKKLKSEKKLQQQQKKQQLENKNSKMKQKKKNKIEEASKTPFESVQKAFQNDHINQEVLQKIFQQPIKKEENLDDLLADYKK